MIKECRVVMSNEYVTVVEFGNCNVQLPSIHSDAKKITVKKENGKYFVVDPSKSTQMPSVDLDKQSKMVDKTKKNKNMKKTTDEDILHIDDAGEEVSPDDELGVIE